MNKNSDIRMYYCRRQPYFFYGILIKNRVLARCMSWLISFALAYLSCKKRKRKLQSEKFLPTSGIKLTTIGLRSHYCDHWVMRSNTQASS